MTGSVSSLKPVFVLKLGPALGTGSELFSMDRRVQTRNDYTQLTHQSAYGALSTK